MIFVEPSCEIIRDEYTIEFALENIERAARICYASEKNSKDNKEFLKSLFNKHHYRPFEFGTIYFTRKFEDILKQLSIDSNRRIIERVSQSPWTKNFYDNEIVYYTTNCRVIIEAIENLFSELDRDEIFDIFWKFIHNIYEHSELHKKRTTILWKISRSIADEFRTHTQISSLMQSTRYCNYSSNKFDNQIRICRPQWVKYSANQLNKKLGRDEGDFDSKLLIFINAWWKSEYDYKNLINIGVTAEEARGILPLDIYTEFIQCGFEEDWINFFNQRYFETTGKAHPDAKYIASRAYLKLKGITE